jgi:hypothetical protein
MQHHRQKKAGQIAVCVRLLVATVVGACSSVDWETQGLEWGIDYPALAKGASAGNAGTNAPQNTAFRRLFRRPETARVAGGHSPLSAHRTSVCASPSINKSRPVSARSISTRTFAAVPGISAVVGVFRISRAISSRISAIWSPT